MNYCGWYALCTNEATKLVAHPILGQVPTCDRCASRYLSLGGKPSDVTEQAS